MARMSSGRTPLSATIIEGQESGAVLNSSDRQVSLKVQHPQPSTSPSSIPTVSTLVPPPSGAMTLNGQADVGPQPALDPISRQILERTQTSSGKSPQLQHMPASPHGISGSVDEAKSLTRQSTGTVGDTESLRRTDSLVSNKLTKEKKKGVSFLSRIMGGKKKEDSTEIPDNASEILDNRPLGVDAELFSQPLGYIPKYPSPPKYIRVKAQNRKKRDFDRLFLAQILSDGVPRSRKGSDELDAKIHSIHDKPVVPPPNSAKVVNNAIWAAEFSKDGHYFAAGGQDRKLKVWKVISSKEDRETSDNNSEFSNENETKVKLNAPVFKQELVREYEGHTSAILDLSWSKNNFLLSSSMDKTVRLYHISRSECLCAFKHNDFVTSIQFHPRDDRFFLAGSLDSRVRLWSIPDKNVAYWAHASDMVTSVAFTPDGKTAIAGTINGLCTLYDVEGLRAHSQIHVRSNRGKNAKGSKITGIETISVSRPNAPPDIKILITSNDSRVRMYHLRDKSLEIKFRGNANTSSQIRATFSDDGKFVICGSEDKKVYIWPTGALERPDSDKRPVEIFEAHRTIVTAALIMPTKSRQLLGQSGDPIYDLCNPPPVRLLNRTDSVLSSQAPTQPSEEAGKQEVQQSGPSTPPDETQPLSTRHSHFGGLVIVTADYTGQIKVFRQDCAYTRRRDSTWDSASFSKKMLGRSSSVVTRNSASSANRRSMTFGEQKNPSNERIINWRNSVVSAKSSAATSTSEVNHHRMSLQEHTRDRSLSPGKKPLAHRFSLRHGSTPLANASRVSTDSTSAAQQQSKAHLEAPTDPAMLQPSAPNSPYYSADEHRRPSIAQPLPNISLNDSNPIPAQSVPSPTQEPNEDGFSRTISQQHAADNNDLFLVGEQSYMAWDMKHTLMPMMHAQPRTPAPDALGGTKGEHNPLSRALSYVSSLSSERRSSVGPSPGPDETAPSLGNSGSASQQEDGEELKCKKCSNESFRMVKTGSGTTVLRCRKCHEPV